MPVDARGSPASVSAPHDETWAVLPPVLAQLRDEKRPGAGQPQHRPGEEQQALEAESFRAERGVAEGGERGADLPGVSEPDREREPERQRAPHLTTSAGRERGPFGTATHLGA